MPHRETIGILAYGSLIEDPGVELAPLISHCIIDVETPFNIEFARSSRTRSGAPTVVPVTGFGAPVKGVILVLDTRVDVDSARDLLWRRETRHEGTDRHITHRPGGGVNQIMVDHTTDFHGIHQVLHTRIAANILDPTPEALARLAIKSAAALAGINGKDGISYLMSLKRQAIQTPLMDHYEAQILEQAGASSLQDALMQVRADSHG